VFRASGQKQWLHPVLAPSALLILAFILNPAFDFFLYTQGTAPIRYLLMCAVVALALPLCENFAAVRRHKIPVLAAVIGGSVAGSGSAVLFAAFLGADAKLLASLATKSVTTPIAVTITPDIGGIAAVAAAVVIVTGLVVAILGPGALRRAGVDDALAAGLALGVAGHGLGTGEAVRRSDVMGAAAAFAMGANGLMTAVILPLFWPYLLPYLV